MKTLYLAVLVLLTLAVACPPAALAADAKAKSGGVIRCPTVLKSFVSLEDSANSKEWLLGGPRQTFILKGARIFVGTLSENSIKPSAEIKPIPHMESVTDQKVFLQVWSIAELNLDQLLLVCDYAGSDNYLIYQLGSSIKKCTELDPMDKSEPTRVECQ